MHLFTDEIDSVNDPDYEPVTSSTLQLPQKFASFASKRAKVIKST